MRFSVQTTSRGREPCRRWRFCDGTSPSSPSRSKVRRGLVVLVESIKLSEAQKRPDRAWLRLVHRAKDLFPSDVVYGRAHLTYSSSDVASTHAQSSTPVPPSFLPLCGRVPQLSSSQRPLVNLRCISHVFEFCRICPKERGIYLKCCCSYDSREALLQNWKDA